ncbi:MAG: hypothetical protein ACRC0X_00070 [Brevinema sp.]
MGIISTESNTIGLGSGGVGGVCLAGLRGEIYLTMVNIFSLGIEIALQFKPTVYYTRNLPVNQYLTFGSEYVITIIHYQCYCSG